MATTQGIEFTINGSANNATNSMEHLVKVLVNVRTSVASTSQSARRAAKSFSAMSVAAKGLSKALSGIKTLGRGIGKALSFSTPLKGIKSFTSALGGLGNMFKRVLLRMAIRNAIKAISQAFKDGVGNLYAWSAALGGDFAASMDRIATAMLYFKNSAGAMVAPLINALAPALDFVIDKAVDLMNVINQLFARLTGASYWTKAIKVAKSYGDAATDAAGSAGQAAKEALRYLAPFDELNVLPSNTGSGGGGGGGSGSGGTDTSGMFEEMVQFDQGITDLADKIKEAWENADFTEIGNLIGTKLKGILDNVPWDEIQDTANRLASSFATLINGIAETEGLWTSVGSTIGEALNTVVGAWNTFFDTVDFTTIGAGLGTALNEAINTINPEELGRALTQKIRAAIDLLVGFVATTDFSTLGSTLATTIRSALSSLEEELNKYNWKFLGGKIVDGINGLMTGLGDKQINLGTTLATALNSALDFVSGAITGANWSGWGKTLATNINSLVGGVNWEQAGETLAGGATGIIDTIVSALTNIEWGTVATSIDDFLTGAINGVSDWLDSTNWTGLGDDIYQGIKDAFNGIDWEQLATDFSSMVGKSLAATAKVGVAFVSNAWKDLKAIWDERMADYEGNKIEVTVSFVLDILQTPAKIKKWVSDNITTPAKDAFAESFGVEKGSEIYNIGSDVVDGLFQGFLAGIPGIGILTWIYNNIATPVLNAVRDAFDTHSPSKKMIAIGKDIGQGLFDGIASIFVNPLAWVMDNIFTPIADGLKRAFAGESIEVKPKITVDESGFGGSAGGTFGDTTATVTIKGEIDPSFTGAKTNYSSVTSGSAVKTLKGETESTFTKIKTAFADIKSNSATKTITGSTNKNFTDVATSFTSVKSNTATKTIKGTRDKKKTFTTIAGWFNSVTSNSATKTIKGADTRGFDDVYKWFKEIKDNTATKTIAGKTDSSFGAAKAAFDSIKDKTATVTTKYSTVYTRQTQASGGVYSGGHWNNITRYASGGLPRGSQLFWAREAGPELVGTLGSHTAVMNNDQIVASVSNGVQRAIAGIHFKLTGANNAPQSDPALDEDMLYRAIMRALNDSDVGDIELDGNVLYRAMVNRNRQNTRMTGVNAMA